MAQAASTLIAAYNAEREPERLALKTAAMRVSVFSFYRGTAHLFWQRLQATKTDASAPSAWCSGDLHLENFGTYLADNGLAYFDINDFDEAAKAPCDWELLRLLSSIAIAAPSLKIGKPDAKALMQSAANAYLAALVSGKARWIERRLAKGAIGDLLNDLKNRNQVRLLDKRTTKLKGRRTLTVPTQRALPVTDVARARLAAFATTLGQQRGQPDYFQFRDAARRIAGTGSLGIARYVLLLEGNGSPDGNVMIDLKAATPSSLAPMTAVKQPRWASEADRVVETQRRCQAVSPHLLGAVVYDGRSFVIKELQPTADRLDLADIASQAGSFTSVAETMGQLAAWAQMRASGRDGSATVDDLVAFAGTGKDLPARWLKTAAMMADATLVDYADYCTAYDASTPATAAPAARPKTKK